MTGRKHHRLREMWCAARSGLGLGGCAIDIEDKDEQRECAIPFASVWLMAGNSLTCIHGAKEWPTSLPASRAHV